MGSKDIESTKILKLFKTALVSFLSELIDQFPKEGDLVILSLFIKNLAPIEDIMKNYISDVIPLRKYIDSRNDKFFLENNVFFDTIDSFDSSEKIKTKINHFKDLWQSESLDEEDRNIIWSWIDHFNQIADEYIKNSKKPFK